jgi:PAS domain S-box-containing protein
VTFGAPASLRLTVPLILLGFAATLSAINVLYHVPRAERAAEESVHEHLTQELSRLQSTLEYLLLKGELEVAQHEIAVLAHNHDYVFAVLTDDHRKVIAATRRAWLGRSIAEVLPQFDAVQASLAVRERRAKVTIDSRDLALLGYAGILMATVHDELRPSRSGLLLLAYDLNRTRSEARVRVLQQSAYWAGWVIALALAMWLAFHFLLTRRTAALMRAAEQLAAGNLNARSGLQGSDELGRLSRAFDAMATRVADTQLRLREDIAELERADHAVRVSEASYRAIFDAAEDAIFVHAIDTGALVDVNPKACAAYGYATREEVVEVLGSALLVGDSPYTPQDARRFAAAAAGEAQYFERHGQNSNGDSRWDEVFIKRVTIGGHDRILILTREITDRKTAEAALRASEEQYRSMFDASIDGLMLWNASGIVDVNPALSKMYGYTEAEFLAHRPIRFADPAYQQGFLQAVTAGQPRHTEFTELRKDGSVLELEVHAVPMQYQGKPHALIIARDVTDKKRAAETLERQHEALHQREKLAALGSLLAGVAHELNNPLSVVVARSVMLEENSDAATQIAAAKIRTAAERCARIVRTFLAMARQQTPEHRPVAINEVVEAALDITGYAVRTSNIEVTLDLATNIPYVLADADQLHQVFLNLIINAQQALQDSSEPRRLEIVSKFDSQERLIRITVADNGPGIPTRLQARVFEPYFTTKPTGIGTGVGLAVSLGIVESHGGTLTVECPSGGGTVFSIALPAVTADPSPRELNRPHKKDVDTKRILVVDDEGGIRETLIEILENAGHEVSTAVSGYDALNRIRAERYDVILTDIRMPDLDGRSLYRELANRWPEQAARVIFLTGDTLASTVNEVATETGRPVIEKPFLPSDVLDIVTEMTKGRMPLR